MCVPEGSTKAAARPVPSVGSTVSDYSNAVLLIGPPWPSSAMSENARERAPPSSLPTSVLPEGLAVPVGVALVATNRHGRPSCPSGPHVGGHDGPVGVSGHGSGSWVWGRSPRSPWWTLHAVFDRADMPTHRGEPHGLHEGPDRDA